jgi:hypothetical protein
MLFSTPFLLQLDVLKKAGPPAVKHISEATDAILAQENTTIKILWAVVCIMGGTLLVSVAIGVAAYRMWSYVKSQEKALTEKKVEVDQALGGVAQALSGVANISDRLEALVKLYQQSQAIDQGHTESHVAFVQGLLNDAHLQVKELYSETQKLHQNAREQDKESMLMASSIKTALELFSGRLLTLQESLVTSITMRESNHQELCTLLNLVLTLLGQTRPLAGTGSQSVSSKYRIQQVPPAAITDQPD